jgi:hypothetical protein
VIEKAHVWLEAINQASAHTHPGIAELVLHAIRQDWVIMHVTHLWIDRVSIPGIVTGMYQMHGQMYALARVITVRYSTSETHIYITYGVRIRKHVSTRMTSWCNLFV